MTISSTSESQEDTAPSSEHHEGAGPGEPPGDLPGARSRYGKALRSPRGLVGVAFVVLPVVISLAAPPFLPYGPNEQGPLGMQPPGGAHLLGTDEVGRDLLARLLAGTRVELLITLIAVPTAAVLGTLFGLIGIVSRPLGAFFQRLFDVLIGVPAILMGVAVALAIPAGRMSVTIAIVLVILPIFGRQAQGAMLTEASKEYVVAADVLGFRRGRVMLRHILPNVADVIFVRIAVEMARAITIEGGLSVIGLGIQPPESSLGSMIQRGSSYLFTEPLYTLAPIAVVLSLIVGYMMLADALNEGVLRQ